MELGAALPHDDAAGAHELSTIALDAQPHHARPAAYCATRGRSVTTLDLSYEPLPTSLKENNGKPRPFAGSKLPAKSRGLVTQFVGISLAIWRRFSRVVLLWRPGLARLRLGRLL